MFVIFRWTERINSRTVSQHDQKEGKAVSPSEHFTRFWSCTNNIAL